MTEFQIISRTLQRLERKIEKMTSPVSVKQFLTPSQIRELYGISEETLRKYRREYKQYFTKEMMRSINGRKHTYEKTKFEEFIYNVLNKRK